jgi:hypothetical protein
MPLKMAKVKQNRFSVIYTDLALSKVERPVLKVVEVVKTESA